MNTKNQPLERAGGPSTLARARFGPGMLLQHDDLEQLNVYTRDLNRLVLRSLFGCGVVCGLVVTAREDCGKLTVTVAGGLALDCQGDPLHVPRQQVVVVDGERHPNLPAKLWVVLCGSLKYCAPRTAMCADDDEPPTVPTRERDYYEIRIMADWPGCACGCLLPNVAAPAPEPFDARCQCADPNDPCHADHYGGTCGAHCGDSASGDCDCVLLAQLDRTVQRERPVWTPDHRVRRFVRPVLMRDPQVWVEEQARRTERDGTGGKDGDANGADDPKGVPPGGTPGAGKPPVKAAAKPKS